MQSESKSKISIVIPNFNRAHNLSEVLEDCINQTSQPFEIIVQDDSFDKQEIRRIDKVISRYEEIKFARNQKNIGLAANVNHAILKAKGDYVAVVNNDDRISVKYVAEIQKFVKKYSNFKTYTTNACAINDGGTVFADYRLYSKSTVIKARKGLADLWNNYFLNLITISGATIYERKYIQSHLFKTKYGNEADLDNALSMLSSQDIMYVDLPIYYVRINKANASLQVRSTNARLNTHIKNCLNIYQKYYFAFNKTPKYMVRPKTVYFLQLFFKYRYPIDKIKSILRIKNLNEIIAIITTTPSYVLALCKHRIMFQLRKNSYRQYRPLNYSA